MRGLPPTPHSSVWATSFQIWDPAILEAARKAEQGQSSEDAAEPELPPAPGGDR